MLVLTGRPAGGQAFYSFVGTTGVGQTSQPATVMVAIAADGVVRDTQVVTQGVPGRDFSLVAGASCPANASVVAGQQCAVAVQFAPTFAGSRDGAILIESADGRLLGSALLGGNASGSLALLIPGRIDTVAGDGAWIFHGDGVPATTAPIFLPNAVLSDAAGNLFLADSNNNRVRRVDAKTGLISTVAGNGTPGLSGDGGPATLAMLNAPGGLAMDGAGNLYVADTGNQVVRRVDFVSGAIATVAGVPTTQGYSGDGSPATFARLSLPEGIAFDRAHNLLIADTGNSVIRLVDAATGAISTVAGTGAAGYNGENRRATTAQLSSPWNLAIGSDGAVYIADLGNNRVRKVDASGTISTYAANGIRGFSGDGSTATGAEFNAPAALAFDPAGNLYVADSGNNRVRKIDAATGLVQTILGTDSEQFGGDAGPADAASLYGPYGLFFDPAGNLFVADMFHNRIRRITAAAISFDYSVLRVDSVSTPHKETLENDGNGPLTLRSIALVNASLDSATTTCSIAAVMASDASCVLGVAFAPTVVGDMVQGSVTLQSDAGNSPAVIDLSGQVLSVEPTSVILSSSANPSLINVPVSFLAAVSSGDPSRGGTVVFDDGTAQLCSVPLSAAGTATCQTSTLTLGRHTVTARYSGDTDNAGSASAPLQQIVQQSPTLILTVTPNPAILAEPIVLSCTATAPTGIPTGIVTFYDGTSAIGTAALTAAGQASISLTKFAAGTHQFSASYAGDSVNASAQSNTVSDSAQPASTATTLTSSNLAAPVGTPVTVTAAVASIDGVAPIGTVLFVDGTNSLGSVTLGSNGTAQLTLSSLAPGTHPIVATYSGDSDNAPSTSIAMLQVVEQIPTVTTLVRDINPVNFASTVKLTATVTLSPGSSASGPIGGQITFTDGPAVLGIVNVDASGTAILSVNTLSMGTHTLAATFGASPTYASSSSNPLTETVLQTATSTALTASGPTSLAGTSVIFSVAVVGVQGVPTGRVTLTDGPTSIAYVQLDSQGNATVTTSALSVGSHTILAKYAGDGNYVGSASAALIHTVSLATATLTIAGPSGPVDAGTPVVVTGTVVGPGMPPTGLATLMDGRAPIAMQTVAAASPLAFSTSTLSIGTHTLTVGYSGDADNAPAVSNALTIVVQQAATTTSLTASANPSVLGQKLTLTASVSSNGPSLSGVVAFQDGSTSLGSSPLTPAGSATLTIGSLAFGPHVISAVFSGDMNHAASSSPSLDLRIVQTATALLAATPNPSTSGNPVTLSVRIAGSGLSTPTGNVTFADGPTLLATLPLDATGTATLQTSTLTVGSHSTSATYGGDGNYAPASALLIETVQSANTQVVLTAGANPAIFGVPLSLQAAIVSNGGVATGSVAFTDGGIPIGSAPLDSSGRATLTISTLAPGIHTLVADYAGDGRASGSTSVPVAVDIRQLTSVLLVSNVNPALTLSPVSFTATLTNGSSLPPTGAVIFSDNGAQLGAAQLNSSGQATLPVATLGAGNHQVVATYAGDSLDFASVSASLTEGVQLRSTATDLTASLTNPLNPLQVTLIAVVRSTGPTTPTGNVTFTSGKNTIGSSPVDSAGVSAITIQLQSASQVVAATYSGDTAYATSASLAVTVTGGLATQYVMRLDPPSLTVRAKQHATTSLTLTSLQGFSDVVELGCLGLPTAATCTFSSPRVNLPANGTVTIQLTVDTGDPLGAGAQANSEVSAKSAGMLCLLPAFLLTGFGLLRMRRVPFVPRLAVLCVLGAALGLTACTGLQIGGTPPGVYSFNVSASGQQTGATQTQIMSLTVTP